MLILIICEHQPNPLDTGYMHLGGGRKIMPPSIALPPSPVACNILLVMLAIYTRVLEGGGEKGAKEDFQK